MRHIFKRALRLAGTAATCAFLFTSLSSAPAQANPIYAAMVVDHHTGEVLFSRNADEARFPASLTKIMTLYMVFDRLRTGELSLTDQMRVSAHAAARPPSKLYLRAGSTITVEDAIKALVTKSANDAAAVIAEHIGGTESNFAAMMTTRARQIGMSSTTFRNASGLPDSQQRTTARDMITLSRSIINVHPDYYGYFNTRSFNFRGNRYGNHNRLLGSVAGVDGIKTGYTRASGFNLTTSLRRDGRHLVAVVMGGRTGASRNAHMQDLLNRTFASASINHNPNPSTVILAAAPVPPSINRPDPNSIIGQRYVQAPTIESIINSLPQQYAEVHAAYQREQQIAAASLDALVMEQGDSSQGNEQIRIAQAQGQPQAQPAAASRPSGWMVQIGAFDSPSQAEAQLGRAQSQLGRQLANASPVTQQFDRGDTMFYRARFAGFSSKQAAESACSALKRQRFACYAVYE